MEYNKICNSSSMPDMSLLPRLGENCDPNISTNDDSYIKLYDNAIVMPILNMRFINESVNNRFTDHNDIYECNGNEDIEFLI